VVDVVMPKAGFVVVGFVVQLGYIPHTSAGNTLSDSL